MKNAKKTLSLVMIAIFTTFIVLSGVPTSAAPKKKAVAKAKVKVTAKAKAQAKKDAAALAAAKAALVKANKAAAVAKAQAAAAAKAVAAAKAQAAKLAAQAKAKAAQEAAQAAIAKAAKATLDAATAAVVNAEAKTNSDTYDLVGSPDDLTAAQEAVTAALESVVKLDKDSSDYAGLMARIDAANAAIISANDQIDQAAQAAAQAAAEVTAEATAETAVAAVEAAPIVTADDLTAVAGLAKTAQDAVAAVTDTTKAADFTARLKVVADKTVAQQAVLDKEAADAAAAAVVAATPAALTTVSAVDGTITVDFDKTPIDGQSVAASDFTVTKTVTTTSAVTTTVVPTAVVASADKDTEYTLTVPAVAPAMTDATVVYNVAYTTGAAVATKAYTVAKIPSVNVASITELNLKQVQVVFNKTVDSTSADNIANYYVGLVALASPTAKAELQADNKTVIITFSTARTQGEVDSYTVSGVLSTNLTETVASAATSVTFLDTTLPTVTSVTVTGNRTIQVTYSEPVSYQASIAATNASSYTLDGYNLTAYGLQSIAYDDTTAPSKSNVVDFNFAVNLPTGAHTFAVVGTSVQDAAGFYVPATTQTVTVLNDTTLPAYVSSTNTGLNTLDIIFNKPILLPAYGTTAYNNLLANTYINGHALVQPNGVTTSIFSQPDSTNLAKVEIALPATANNTLTAGANIVDIVEGFLSDYYGNTNSTSDIRFAVTAVADTTAPTVVTVASVDDAHVTVTYSEAMGLSATALANYSLRTTAGTVINPVQVTKDSTNTIYTLVFASTLLGGTHIPGGISTLTIANVADTSSNAIVTVSKTLSVTDTTPPTVTSCVIANSPATEIRVTFSEPMNFTSLTTLTDYTYAGSALQAGTTLTPSADNTSVLITFPTTVPVAHTAFQLILLKDAAGNFVTNTFNGTLYSYSVPVDIQGTTTAAPELLRARAISTTQVEVEYKNPLTSVDYHDFYYNGVQATSAYFQNINVYDKTGTTGADSTTLVPGTKITLTFATVDPAVSGALTVISTGASEDGLGNHVNTPGVNSAAYCGVNQASIPAYNYANVAANTGSYVIDKVAPTDLGTAAVAAIIDTTHISYTFLEPIQTNLAGLYNTDFVVVNGGSNIVIDSAAVNGNTITLALDSALDLTQITTIAPKATVHYVQDVNGNLFVPTATDIAGYTVPVSATLGVINQIAALPAANTITAANAAANAAAITSAANAFAALSNANQALVTNSATLTAIQTAEANATAAAVLVAQIAALPATIAVANIVAVTSANTAFGLLSVAQKALVTNSATLTADVTAATNLTNAKTALNTEIGLANAKLAAMAAAGLGAVATQYPLVQYNTLLTAINTASAVYADTTISAVGTFTTATTTLTTAVAAPVAN